MALTGLEIYKLLPKTNCKECGFPTCLAFAMKLAQKGTELDKCPYVSDEAKTALDAASAPPIKLVTIGAGERAFEIGNEVVLFRHEKTFYHQPGLVVRVKSDDPQLAEKAAARRRLRGRARRHEAAPRRPRRGARRRRRGRLRRGRGRGPRGRPRPAARAHERRRGGRSTRPSPAAPPPRSRSSTPPRPPTGRRWPRSPRSTAARWRSAPRTATSSALADLSENVRGAGVEDLVLDPGTAGLAGDLAAFTQLRRLALKKGARALGLPDLRASPARPPGRPSWCAPRRPIAKYAGVVVLDHLEPGVLLRPAHAAPEHLHRPAEAHPGGAEALRDRHRRTRQPACSSPPTSR